MVLTYGRNPRVVLSHRWTTFFDSDLSDSGDRASTSTIFPEESVGLEDTSDHEQTAEPVHPIGNSNHTDEDRDDKDDKEDKKDDKDSVVPPSSLSNSSMNFTSSSTKQCPITPSQLFPKPLLPPKKKKKFVPGVYPPFFESFPSTLREGR